MTRVAKKAGLNRKTVPKLLADYGIDSRLYKEEPPKEALERMLRRHRGNAHAIVREFTRRRDPGQGALAIETLKRWCEKHGLKLADYRDASPGRETLEYWSARYDGDRHLIAAALRSTFPTVTEWMDTAAVPYNVGARQSLPAALHPQPPSDSDMQALWCAQGGSSRGIAGALDVDRHTAREWVEVAGVPGGTRAFEEWCEGFWGDA